MTDTEILEAIIANQMWVHPTGGFYKGWNASAGKYDEMWSWNEPTLRQAVEKALSRKRASE